MMRSKTLIEVLSELTDEYVYIDGVRGMVPRHPVRIDGVVGDKLHWFQCMVIGKGMKTGSFRGEIHLSHIFRIRSVDTDNVLWETNEFTYIWKLRSELTKPLLDVEFDYSVDTRFIHIKGYVDEIKVIDGKECIHVERIHDGIILSKRWLDLDKISNLKFTGGYEC